MYCTGGIRCEKASAYMKLKGIDEVYQLSGGIHRYVEQYPDGHFRGKNFVFDNRQALKANDDILANCGKCGKSYDYYRYCTSKGCKTYVIICDECYKKSNEIYYCCEECRIDGPEWEGKLKKQRNIQMNNLPTGKKGTKENKKSRHSKQIITQKKIEPYKLDNEVEISDLFST